MPIAPPARLQVYRNFFGMQPELSRRRGTRSLRAAQPVLMCDRSRRMPDLKTASTWSRSSDDDPIVSSFRVVQIAQLADLVDESRVQLSQVKVLGQRVEE